MRLNELQNKHFKPVSYDKVSLSNLLIQSTYVNFNKKPTRKWSKYKNPREKKSPDIDQL